MIDTLHRLLSRSLVVYAAVPIIIALALIWQKGLLTPAYDELYIVQPIVVQARAGDLPAGAIVQAYNGQRIPIPLLITTAFALVTGWDVRADLVFNVILIGIVCALAIATWRQQRLPIYNGAIWVLLLCLLLTPVQFINFTFGFQKCIWLMMLGVYGSAYAAARWPGRSLAWVIGALSAFVATWSFLSGHVLWIVIPIGLWLSGEQRWRPFALWLAFAAANIVLYLIGYTVSDTPVETAPSLLEQGRFLIFPLTFLGGPFSGDISPLVSVGAQDTTQSALIGLLGVLLLLVTLGGGVVSKTLDLRRAAPWLMLILFSLGCAAMIVLGRALEPKDTITSRYATLALPFWIGLIGLLLQTLGGKTALARWRSGVIVLGALTLPVLLGTFTLTFYNFAAIDTERDRMLQCLLALDGPDCASALIGEDAAVELGDDLVIERVRELRALQLSAFGLPALVDLQSAAIQPNADGGSGMTWEVSRIGSAVTRVLLMYPPAQADIQIYVPDALAAPRLSSAIYMPHPQFIPGEGNRLLADGADFTLAVIDESGQMQTVFTGGIDPAEEADPIPFSVDLADYRGQIITLRFMTDARANSEYDWALWVDPRVSE